MARGLNNIWLAILDKRQLFSIYALSIVTMM